MALSLTVRETHPTLFVFLEKEKLDVSIKGTWLVLHNVMLYWINEQPLQNSLIPKDEQFLFEEVLASRNKETTSGISRDFINAEERRILPLIVILLLSC